MTTKTRLFLLLTTLFIFGISNTACTQQKQDMETKETATEQIQNDEQATQDNEQTIAQNATSPGVFELNGVAKVVPNTLTDFTFLQDGKTVSIAEYTKGKYVFLNFWGTWCPPCRREIPDIIEIQKELGDELVVVGVALERGMNFDDAQKSVSDFAASNGINYLNVAVNGKNSFRATLAEAYGGIQYVPTTFLIDKDRNIFEVIQGGRSKEDFMKSINKMMKK